MPYFTILIIAIVTAFLFRFIPIFWRNLPALNDPASKTYKFLAYSSQAMLGILTYELIFGKTQLGDLLLQVSLAEILGMIILLSAFAVVALTNQVAMAFILGTGLYFIVILQII